jgi:hypothetical protein
MLDDASIVALVKLRRIIVSQPYHEQMALGDTKLFDRFQSQYQRSGKIAH